MERAYYFAGMVLLMAFSDNLNATFVGQFDLYGVQAPAPSTITIAGRISVSRRLGEDQVIELQGVKGGVFRLQGSASLALASVNGGHVVVRGTFEASPGFVVEDFQLIGIHGRGAIDGVLVVTEGGLAIRLNDGLFQAVPGLPAEATAYIGSRLWVIGWDYDPPVKFGVIAAR